MKSVEARQKLIKELVHEKNKAYWERNQLLAYISKIKTAWLEKHPESDTSWKSEWRNIVFIQMAEGIHCWHIHDDEMQYFTHLNFKEGNSWDGSTTEEKYASIRYNMDQYAHVLGMIDK